MNVLPLVFTVLALFGIVTYARFQNFTISKVVDQQYKAYCQQEQFKRANGDQLALYEKAHCQTGQSGGSAEKSSGRRKLDLSEITIESEGANFKRRVLKNLIHVIYGNEPFFLEATEKNSLIVDQAIEALQKEAKNLKEFSDLHSIKYNDPKIQEFWYYVLRDPSLEEAEEDLIEPSPTSLKSNLGFQKASIRIYLASRELLLSLFEDKKIVEEIVNKRKEIYNKLKKADEIEKERLRQEFTSSFMESVPKWVPQNQLNWEVSKTNPNS